MCVSTDINWNVCDVLLTPQQILVFDGKPGQVPGEFHIIHKLPPRDPIPLHIHIFVAGNADIRRKVWRRHPSQKSFRHFSTVLPHSFSGDTNFSFLRCKKKWLGKGNAKNTFSYLSHTNSKPINQPKAVMTYFIFEALSKAPPLKLWNRVHSVHFAHDTSPCSSESTDVIRMHKVF